METIITKTDKYILLTVKCSDEKSLSWEQLNDIKQNYFPNKTFVEIYPKITKVVNNVNERHLYHVYGMELPCLTELENEVNFEII